MCIRDSSLILEITVAFLEDVVCTLKETDPEPATSSLESSLEQAVVVTISKQANAILNKCFIGYNSKARLTSLSINNSSGFSNASLTATRKPTDSFPSIILWS